MRLRLWTAEDRLCEENKNTVGRQQAAESSWISHRISTRWCLVPLLWRLEHIPEVSPFGKWTLPCADTCLKQGPDCTAPRARDSATLHSLQWTWGSAANLPRAWMGDWRGSISQHIAHEAQQGSWGEGSRTPTTLKQVQWEQEAEAVSIFLPPCPAVPLMSPVLLDTCAKSWHLIGALQNLLRALLYFSLTHLADSHCTCFRLRVPSLVRSFVSVC